MSTSLDLNLTLSMTSDAGPSGVSLRATPRRTMPLGDSITWGQVIEVPAERWVGYRLSLWQQLAAAGVSVELVGSQASGPIDWPGRHHEGHGGYPTLRLMQGLPAWISAARPQIVLLQAGAPDRLVGGLTPELFAGRYRALVRTIHELDPSIETVASSVTPCASPASAVALAAPFNAAIASVVAERRADGQRVRFADVGGQVPLSGMGADGTHPAPAGYAALADGWVAAVLDVINHPTAWEKEGG
jgi:lysophospholipase L1-like esterase